MKDIFHLLLLLLSISVVAQDYSVGLDYYLPTDVSYNKNIPTPKSIVGHEVGEWHITHDKLVQYMYALANSSNRITIEDRGKTFEGRPLLLLTITTPTNHTNIEQIRKEHLSLADASFKININEMPAVIYQGLSIHGNEASGSNAALAVAYYLAAAQGPKIDVADF